MSGLVLGGTNFGYLNSCSLDDALAHLAGCGMRVVELGLAAPHFDLTTATRDDVNGLRATLDRLELDCCSVNAAELNLISQNVGVARLAVTQYARLIEVAAELGVDTAVIVPGRQHPLRPCPSELAFDNFRAQLATLLRCAEKHRVTIALETVPFGFLQRTDELRDFVIEVNHPLLSMVVDCANVFMLEDPVDALRAGRPAMRLCHVSDAWKTRWAHTSIGSGEIDFAAIGKYLNDDGYQGVTIYELMDAHDPVPRLARDIAALESYGWHTGPSASNAARH
jgi:sugar phosphate isomerase/epimerase